MICLKISIFVVSNTTQEARWYRSSRVVICLKISIFVVSNTTESVIQLPFFALWFAWKFLSLWYQTQLQDYSPFRFGCCDLLENFYLCGIKHNYTTHYANTTRVVICLKISIFVVSNTTTRHKSPCLYLLWFAWKFLSLWYQTQQPPQHLPLPSSCDLLENFYLCGIKHNSPL